VYYGAQLTNIVLIEPGFGGALEEFGFVKILVFVGVLFEILKIF
jgi:hypothetical protein